MGLIFVEGLPCAGKSLLVKHMAEQGHSVVHELGRVINKAEFPGDGQSAEEIRAIDYWFIGKESERHIAHQGGIFDRSYLTHLTYAYAYSQHTGIPSFTETVSRYRDVVSNGSKSLLPNPDGIIFLDIAPRESIQRQEQKIMQNPKKALAPFWRMDSFLNDLVSAYHALFTSLQGVPVLTVDGTLTTEDKYSVAKPFIELSRCNGHIDFNHYLRICS